MDIEYVGHACVKITNNNFTLITDPWFGTPFCLDAMNAYPPIPVPNQNEIDQIQAIHISHIHSDHFCKKSLGFFKKNTPVYIAQYENKYFLNSIRNLGFFNVFEIPPGFDGLQVGPFRVYSFLCVHGEFTFDSAMIVEQDHDSIYLNNDCVLSEQQIIDISIRFKKIKGGFLGYCDINQYPTCYDTSQIKNYNGPFSLQDQINKMQSHRKDYFTFICNQLNLDWAAPYANGIRFFDEDLYIHNRYFTSPDIFNDAKTQANILIDIKYSDKLNIRGEIVSKSEPAIPPLLSFKRKSNLTDEEFTDDYDEKIKNVICTFISVQCQNWTKSMTLMFKINSAEKQFKFTIFCDLKTTSSADLEPELIVEYNFSDIKKVCDGKVKLAELHSAYKFYATIIYVHSKQVLIHRWPRLKKTKQT